MKDLIDNTAELDDDEDDESFDEETGEVHKRKGDRRRENIDDSSEEDEDDDDEEEARKVWTYQIAHSKRYEEEIPDHPITQIQEGFIVDEDDEDDEDDDQAVTKEKRRKRKRRQEREDVQLDEEDLDLIGETWERKHPSEVRSFMYAFQVL